ncbi:MAG: alpha/beta fold hydrolase [Thermoplasmata archaeon]
MPFITRGGVKIHYEVEGEGPPLLLHTGGAGDLESWRLAGYADALRSEYRLILVDHRGHGKSDKPDSPTAHRIEEYRDDVRAVLDAVGCARTIFVGFSDGSKVGATLAESDPGRVFALIDIDGFEPRDLTDPKSRDRQTRSELAQLIRQHGWAEAARAWAKDEGYRGPESIVENMAATDPEMFALELEQWTQWDGPASVLRHLRVPVLLLQAERSYSEEERRAMTQMNPRSRSRVLPGVGHLGAFVSVDLVIPPLREFLSTL